MGNDVGMVFLYSFGIEPTMQKMFHNGVMHTLVDDCQFVCIEQQDYYRIQNKVLYLCNILLSFFHILLNVLFLLNHFLSFMYFCFIWHCIDVAVSACNVY